MSCLAYLRPLAVRGLDGYAASAVHGFHRIRYPLPAWCTRPDLGRSARRGRVLKSVGKPRLPNITLSLYLEILAHYE